MAALIHNPRTNTYTIMIMFNISSALVATIQRFARSVAGLSFLGLLICPFTNIIAETVVDQRFEYKSTNVIKWSKGMQLSLNNDADIQTPSGNGALMVRVEEVDESISERSGQIWMRFPGERFPEGTYRMKILWKASAAIPVLLQILTEVQPYDVGAKCKDAEISDKWTTETWEFQIGQGSPETFIRVPLIEFADVPAGTTFWIASLKVESIK